ncbi:polyprenyl synthetase family protein [Ferroplasma sp.]|uniref:polyprenyl synthetase family protein n=1 Tax=Ferroplasma sp. TaxID=2591003 RepID=UPI0026052EA8|nr:polyprenyl synthetase family protein [Ferroplasma sp.]
MNNIENYRKRLDDLRERINYQLESYFKYKLDECNDSKIAHVIEKLRDFTMNGGKRVRPILMIMGYSMFAKPDYRIIKASISIEMAQSFLLIHDDIMDQSDMRRGQPSFHRAVEKTLNGDHVERIAENIAISAGDLIDTFSHEALLRSGFGLENLLDADFEFSKIIEDTGKGQILDIYSSIEDVYSEDRLIKLHFLKTARYTIQGPLLMGAYLSGNKKYIQDIKDYGKYAGIAFQLYDDLLGLFGSEEKTGKSIKSDVNEGKKTLLMIKAYENSSEEIRKFIESCLKNGNINDSDFNRLREIVKSTGSYEYTKQKIDEYNDLARSALARIDGNRDTVEMLDFLLEYLIKREN